MRELHEVYPVYDFETHKGYITPTHAAALEEHGPCDIHRRRFVNVRRALGEPVPDDADPLGDNDLTEDMTGDLPEELAGDLGELADEPLEAESMEVGR
jgi:hypothetical protein